MRKYKTSSSLPHCLELVPDSYGLYLFMLPIELHLEVTINENTSKHKKKSIEKLFSLQHATSSRFA
jgi:hypothetical protein